MSYNCISRIDKQYLNVFYILVFNAVLYTTFNSLGLTDLLLLASLPSTEGSAITEGFKFMNEVLKHALKTPDEAYVGVLIQQISSLSQLTHEQLGCVVKKLVVPASEDEAAKIAVNTSLLHTFVERLTNPEW